jgi:hypothetical protein
MSDSLFIPIARIPSDLEEAKTAIIQGLAELAEPAPEIRYRTAQSGTHDLERGQMEVYGRSPYDACRVSFYGLEFSAREPDESDLAFVASVLTRRNSWFAGAVAFGLAMNFGGRVVYDDSLMLHGTDRYRVQILGRILKEGLQGERRF